MVSAKSPIDLDRVSFQRRRNVGRVAVAVTIVYTLGLWVQTLASGNSSLNANYLIPLVVQVGLAVLIHRWGVNRLVFVAMAVTLDVGFVCTLALPGAHGTFVAIFFSAVPLFYILGGAPGGRVASLVFFVLAVGLLTLRFSGVLPVRNVVAPNESLVAALACIVFQFVMAEANEREHRFHLKAVLAHHFQEPNSGLPNRNALVGQTVAPGQALVLIKAGPVSVDGTQVPGTLGRALRQRLDTGWVLYWIAEDEYAVLCPEGSVGGVKAAVGGGPAEPLPGLHPRARVRVSAVFAREPLPAARALEDAELRCLAEASATFDPYVSASVQDNARALRACFRDGRLTAVFQPIYDCQAGGIAVLEALTRLDLNGKLVSPEPYLGLIESLGLDRQLTEFILREAVRMGLETDYSVSLNLTYRDLEDQVFLPRLLDACAPFRNRRNKLIFELTEHLAFSDPQLLSRFIALVHDAGGLVFLDDFGMGYSNFASVAAARFDAIKVSGALVRQAPASDELKVLLEGIVRFARASHLELVAEHISDPGIFDLIRGEGIRYLQGFLLQRPVLGDLILGEGFEFAAAASHELALEVNSRSLPFGRDRGTPVGSRG